MNGGIGMPMENSTLKARRIRAIYTLVPYSGDTLGSIPADAQPFVPISTNGLLYWDGTHLTGPGREVATEALFEGLEKQALSFGRPVSTR